MTSVAAAAVLAVAVAAGAGAWRVASTVEERLHAQDTAMAALQRQVAGLNAAGARDTGWSAIVAKVEPSVVTVETADDLGSGWVVRSNASGSEVVTNYHVVETALNAGASTVDVRRGDVTMPGVIRRVAVGDDLAIIHVSAQLPPLQVAAERPRLGTVVMAVGSPLGLGGSVSLGIVAGYRSLAGADYIQFSAPISPGNSGGPVIDSGGRVVAVASAKLVGDGVEALSLAIPAAVVCDSLQVCAGG